VMGKLFFFPLGLYSSEVYAYSEIIWEMYINDKKVACPYKLDGLMYTPLNQKYTRNLKEIRYQIYKWKPPSHNSIDFYVKFERNPETQQLLNVYDNSTGKNIEDVDEKTDEIIDNYKANDKLYRICNLYVGSTKTGVEEPTLFGRENNLYLAYLYLNDGEIRDLDGNLIQDNTVVEFIYNNNPLLEHPYRWIPLRTRFDKTESVIKYHRKYGNNEVIANKVWRSIITPVTFDDIKMLAKENEYENYMKDVIKSRVTKEDIVKERSENIYYQISSDLMEPMRNFHNFVKSNLIYMYCGKKCLTTNKYKALDVLDVGIGRGGDIMKYYHARVNNLTAFDPVSDNLFSATDGVMSRYQTFKRKFPNFPKYNFMIADGGALLNAESQEKAIGTMSDINKETIKNIFGSSEKSDKFHKFDVFSCQFMFHYLFKDDTTFGNFCANVNKYLNSDGYLIIITVDGKLLHNSFVNDKVTTYYTDSGKKKVLFEYQKLYSGNDIQKTGLPITYFDASFMMENTSITEYLVDSEYLINELESRCNMTLIESDKLENQFMLSKIFFEDVAPYEANDKTRNYFMKVKEFYNFDDEVNKNSFESTKLYRYYVFQKL